MRRRGQWWLWQRSNDVRAARENVHRHYDLGNDFYRLWLDREMVYTCAYFPTPDASLEEAQIAKMDLVCRKLRLRPGERVVEAGCGWGALALHMARHYGVTVRAFNISAEQIALRARAGGARRARRPRRVRRGRLPEHQRRSTTRSCRSACSSTSAWPTTDARRRHRPLAGRDTAAGCCTSSAATGRRRSTRGSASASFPARIRRRCARCSSTCSSRTDFSVLDVENLRLHYARTLEHWRQRFDDAARRGRAAMFDETFVRAWRLYLAGSQAAFTTGSMQLFQVVFARGSSNEIPWTRRG